MNAFKRKVEEEAGRGFAVMIANLLAPQTVCVSVCSFLLLLLTSLLPTTISPTL